MSRAHSPLRIPHAPAASRPLEPLERTYERSPVFREAAAYEEDGEVRLIVRPDLHEIANRFDGDIDAAVTAAQRRIGRRLPAITGRGTTAPSVTVVHEPLPRLPDGTLDRAALPALAARAPSTRASVPTGPLPLERMSAPDRHLLEHERAHAVWTLLAERYPDRMVTPDAIPPLHLGVDSLEWVDLTLEIAERTGVLLDERTVGAVETVRDLLRAVKEAPGGPNTRPPRPTAEPDAYVTPEQRPWLEPLGPLERVGGFLFYAFFKGILRTAFRLRVVGLERLPDDPVILAPNHVSYLDPPAILAAIPYARTRTLFWAGASDVVFHSPPLRLIGRLGQTVPLERSRGPFSSLALGAEILRRGDSLVWFPEGTRNPSGELRRFKPGVARLARDLGVRVVPVFVHGAREALPAGRLRVRFTPVTVVFGTAKSAVELDALGSGGTPEERIAEALRREVAALEREARALRDGDDGSAGA